MTDELRKKLTDSLEKSGFGSEMRALGIVRSNGWPHAHTGFYFDRDISKTREIDIFAFRSPNIDDGHGADHHLEFFLSAEIKKSEKPWVFIKAAPDPKGVAPNESHRSIYSDLVPRIERSELFRLIDEGSLTRKIGWWSLGAHEAFKDPDAPSRWYAAAIAAIKASHHRLIDGSEHEDMIEKHARESGGSFTQFAKPIVIVDGMMCSAALDAADKIIVEEMPFCSVLLEWGCEAYPERSYSVDFIQIEALKNYLAIANSQFDGIYQRWKKGKRG